MIDPRAIAFDVSDLVDLAGTPWRRIWLSAREPIWTLVDAEDFAWLSDNIWNVSWGSRTPWQKYGKRNVGADRATLRIHREIMIAADPKPDAYLANHFVDHINGHTLDNRRANLRWATKAENHANKRARGTAPSLDVIVVNLLAGLPVRELEEVPF